LRGPQVHLFRRPHHLLLSKPSKAHPCGGTEEDKGGAYTVRRGPGHPGCQPHHGSIATGEGSDREALGNFAAPSGGRPLSGRGTNLEEANSFLASYRPGHNSLFFVTPKDEMMAFMSGPSKQDLALIQCRRSFRKTTGDSTVSWQGKGRVSLQ
jgi:hypothetical protein